jgi:cation:H+ antiporter
LSINCLPEMTDFAPDYILFTIGLGLLLASAELLVRNAAKLASLIGKSSLFIGLTITAFGTSAPELAVGISGQLSQNSDVGLGNIVGSNIFNIFFVLGLAAVIRPIVVQKPVIRRDIPILLVVCVLFFLFALSGTISTFESIVLLSALVIYLYYLSRSSNQRSDVSSEDSPLKTAAVDLNSSRIVPLILIAVSIVVMVAGAHLVVKAALPGIWG